MASWGANLLVPGCNGQAMPAPHLGSRVDWWEAGRTCMGGGVNAGPQASETHTPGPAVQMEKLSHRGQPARTGPRH